MILFLNILFMAIVLGFAGFISWYVAFRLHSLFGLTSLGVMQAIVAVVMVLSMVALFAFIMPKDQITGGLNLISGYVILFIFYLFFILGLIHFVQLFYNPAPMLFGSIAVVIALLIVVTSGVMGSFFTVKETEIKISGLEQELVIMQLSDVHLGHKTGTKYLQKIVQATNKYNPALVLITGDLIESEMGMQPDVLAPLSNINAPIYFVEGNHDKYAGIEKVTSAIKNLNVNILHNEIVVTNGIQLIGLAYLKADEKTFDMHPSDNTNTIKSIMEQMPINKEIPSILMAHSPTGVKYIEPAGVNVMLAGHTHAGQIFPFSLFAKLHFKHYKGLYKHGNLQVFISNGASTFGIKARIGSLNEINLIRLVPMETN